MGSKQNEPELRGRRATPEQTAHIINYMFCHRNFAHGTFRGPMASSSMKREWKRLAAEVNSVNGGMKRTVVGWKKTWADIKSNTKVKATELICERNRTGRFPIGDHIWNMLERKVLAVLGQVAVEGIPGAKDSMPESQAAQLRLMSGDRSVIDGEDPVSLFEAYNIDVELNQKPLKTNGCVMVRQSAQTSKEISITMDPTPSKPSCASSVSKEIHLPETTTQATAMPVNPDDMSGLLFATQTHAMEVNQERAVAEKRNRERLEIERTVADFEEIVDWNDFED